MARCNVINIKLVLPINMGYIWESLIISIGEPGPTLECLIQSRKSNLKMDLFMSFVKRTHIFILD